MKLIPIIESYQHNIDALIIPSLFPGFAGIGCIALGIGSGFGLVMLTGQYFVAFVGTLPFLVLGVGIDDMFIILDGKVFVFIYRLCEFLGS